MTIKKIFSKRVKRPTQSVLILSKVRDGKLSVTAERALKSILEGFEGDVVGVSVKLVKDGTK